MNGGLTVLFLIRHDAILSLCSVVREQNRKIRHSHKYDPTCRLVDLMVKLVVLLGRNRLNSQPSARLAPVE